MKVLKKNKKYIKDVIKYGSISGGNWYQKKKITFTLEDLKEFGPKNVLNFLEAYYCVRNRAYYEGGGVDIWYWINKLIKHNIEMIILPKQEIQILLFPMIVDEENGERAADVIKSHKKIVKALSGSAIYYKRQAQKNMEKSEDIKKKLISSGNWAWSKKKEV